jgi:hypothetical protein
MTADEVKTADEMGWAELGNGELLMAAQGAGFRSVGYGRQESVVSTKPAAGGACPGCAQHE